MEVPERIETDTSSCAARGAATGRRSTPRSRLRSTSSPVAALGRPGLSVDESEANCRRQQARFMLREDFVFLIFAREADGPGRRVARRHRPAPIDWGLRRFEIGYWRKTGCEGRGIVTEATKAMAGSPSIRSARAGSSCAWTTATSAAGRSPSAPASR
jgi:hypothetical protein